MQIKRNKIKIIVVTLILAVSISSVTANDPFSPFGKLAEDGTNMLIRYYDPNVQTLGDNDTLSMGMWRDLPDYYDYLKYQDLAIFFDLNERRNDQISFTVDYFTKNNTGNTTVWALEESFTIEITINNTATVAVEYKLRIDANLTRVIISYLDVNYSFYHKTSPEQIQVWITQYLLKQRMLIWLGITLSVMAVSLLSAYLIRKKAVNFDVPLAPVLLFLLAAADIALMLFMFYYFFSFKLILYLVPWWIYFVVAYVISTIIFIKAMNPERVYRALHKYNIPAWENDPVKIPISYNGKMFMDEGLAASLIRLFTPRSFNNSIRSGKFLESDKTVRHIVSPKRAEDMIEEGIDIFKTETVSENQVVVYRKIDTAVFTQATVPKQPLECNWNEYKDEIHCKNFRVTKSQFAFKWYHHALNSAFFFSAFFFIIFYNSTSVSDNYRVFIKLTIAVIAALLILTVLRFAAAPGFVEFEPGDIFMIKELLEAIKVLGRTERLSELVSNLTSENFDLRTTMKQKILNEATDLSEGYIDKIIALVEGEKLVEDNKD